VFGLSFFFLIILAFAVVCGIMCRPVCYGQSFEDPVGSCPKCGSLSYSSNRNFCHGVRCGARESDRTVLRLLMYTFLRISHKMNVATSTSCAKYSVLLQVITS